MDEYGKSLPDHSYMSSNGGNYINTSNGYQKAPSYQYQQPQHNFPHNYNNNHHHQVQYHSQPQHQSQLQLEYDNHQFSTPPQHQRQHQHQHQHQRLQQYPQPQPYSMVPNQMSFMQSSPQVFHNSQTSVNTNHTIHSNHLNHSSPWNINHQNNYSSPSPHQHSMRSYIELHKKSPLDKSINALYEPHPSAKTDYNFNHNSPYQINPIRLVNPSPQPSTKIERSYPDPSTIREFSKSTIGFKRGSHHRYIVVESSSLKVIMDEKYFWDDHEETEEVNLLRNGSIYLLFIMFIGPTIPIIVGKKYRNYTSCKEYYVKDPSKVYVKGAKKKKGKNELKFSTQEVASLFHSCGSFDVRTEDDFYVVHVADENVLEGIKTKFQSCVKNGKLILTVNLDTEFSTLKVFTEGDVSASEAEEMDRSDIESNYTTAEKIKPDQVFNHVKGKSKQKPVQNSDIMTLIEKSSKNSPRDDDKKFTQFKIRPQETRSNKSYSKIGKEAIANHTFSSDSEAEENSQGFSKPSTNESSISNRDLIQAIDDENRNDHNDIIMSNSPILDPKVKRPRHTKQHHKPQLQPEQPNQHPEFQIISDSEIEIERPRTKNDSDVEYVQEGVVNSTNGTENKSKAIDIEEIESQIISDTDEDNGQASIDADKSMVINSEDEEQKQEQEHEQNPSTNQESDFTYTKLDKDQDINPHDIDTQYLIIRHVPYDSQKKLMEFVDDVINRLSSINCCIKNIYAKQNEDQICVEFSELLDVCNAIKNIHGYKYEDRIMAGLLCDHTYADQQISNADFHFKITDQN